MSCTLEIKDSMAVVILDGEVGIDNAAQIHATLSEAHATRLPVALETAGLTGCDVSFLQLIGATCRTLGASGINLLLYRDEVSDVLRDAVQKAGYHFKEHCATFANRECFFAKLATAPSAPIPEVGA